MNKRQKKKRAKNIHERFKFFNKHLLYSGRQNGKTYMFSRIMRACHSKHYKPFKDLKKVYSKLIIGVDLSNGRDYRVETVVRLSNDKVNIVKSSIIIDEMHSYRG